VPPALLRTLLRRYRSTGGDNEPTNTRFSADLVRVDEQFVALRSAYTIRQAALRRALLVKQGPSGIEGLPVLGDVNGELRSLIQAMCSAQEQFLTARLSNGDCAGAESRVLDVERALERYFVSQKGAAE
jgi:hypothetical protein